ncbi:MAG: cytochrome c biogenesis protein CcsA [Candidatus Hodarchaeales archaeon]
MSGKYIEKWELASEISLVIGNGALISSFLYFGYAHVTADYSFVNVSTNVSNDMDFMLRVSAIWSGQAGSYLFWAFSISVFYLIFRFYFREVAHEAIVWRSFVFCSLQVAFLAALTLLSKAFETNADPMTDGVGLNPLLRNYWNVVHPPVILLGYAACMIPTGIAIARMSVLKDGKVPEYDGKARLDKFFEFNMSLAWLVLTAGIVLGGYWAYITLGWGGFWAWDPVETVSLIPWLFITLYFHGTPFHAKNRYLESYIGSMSYISSLFATLITRSNIISSVHTFQPDESVFFLTMVCLGSFLLPHLLGLREGAIFSIDLGLGMSDFQSSRSKTTALKISYLAGLIGTYAIIVGLLTPVFYDFIGNFYPPLFDAFGPSITIEMDYYNNISAFFGGIMLIAGFFCKFFPEMEFRNKVGLMAGGVIAGILFFAGGNGTLESLVGEGNPILDFFDNFWTPSDKANFLIPIIFVALLGTLATVITIMVKEEKDFFRKSSQAILHFSLLVIILGALLSANRISTHRVMVTEDPVDFSIDGTSYSVRVIDLTKTIPEEEENSRYSVIYETSFAVKSGSDTVGIGVTRLQWDKKWGEDNRVTIINTLSQDIYVVTTQVIDDRFTGRFIAAELQLKFISYINVLWLGCLFLHFAILPLVVRRALDFKNLSKKKDKGSDGVEPIDKPAEKMAEHANGP